MFKRTLMLASSFALLACGAREPVWELGVSHAYQLTLHSQYGVDTSAPMFAFDLTGTLQLVPFERRGSQVEFWAIVVDPKLSMRQSTQSVEGAERIASDLQQAFAFTLDGGRLTSIRSSHALHPLAAGIVRTLSSALQRTHSRAGDARRWKVSEYDATGRYEVEYERAEPALLRKRKLRYERMTTEVRSKSRLALPGGAEPPRIDRSNIEIRGAEAAPESLALDEQLEATLSPVATLGSQTTLTLSHHSVVPRALSDRERAELAANTLVQSIEEPIAVPAPADLDAVKIGSFSFEAIVAGLEALAQSAEHRFEAGHAPDRFDNSVMDARRRADPAWMNEQTRLFLALNATLRKHPETLPQVGVLIRGGSAASDALISGLAASGTNETQALLLELMDDRALPQKSRNAAGFALIRTPKPSLLTVRAIEAKLDDPTWARLAAYGLGTYARLLMDAGNTEEATRLRGVLAQRFHAAQAARDSESKVDALLAMSNTGSPEILDFARAGLISDPNKDVRRATVLGLRLIRGDEADALLTDALASDGDKRVRLAALQSLNKRSASKPIAEALTRAALHDPSARVRHEAVRHLARLSQNSEVRSALEQVSSSDANDTIRSTAAAALASSPNEAHEER